MNRALGKGSFCSQKFPTPLFFCLVYWLTGGEFKNTCIALFPCVRWISCIWQLFQSALIFAPKKCTKFPLQEHQMSTSCLYLCLVFFHLCALKPIWQWGLMMNLGFFWLPELFLLRSQHFEPCLTNLHLQRKKKISSPWRFGPTHLSSYRTYQEWKCMEYKFAHACRYICLCIQVHNDISTLCQLSVEKKNSEFNNGSQFPHGGIKYMLNSRFSLAWLSMKIIDLVKGS